MKLQQVRNPKIFNFAASYNAFTHSKDAKNIAISFKEYVIILNDFIKLVSDEIITNNYKFYFTFGYCHLIKKERNFSVKAVNFGASNKIKKEILARGGKLATVIGRDVNNEPIFDDGEKWMVFHVDDYYFVVDVFYTYFKGFTPPRQQSRYCNWWSMKPMKQIKQLLYHYKNNNKLKESKLKIKKLHVFDNTKRNLAVNVNG